jgi:uncharacterized membrane protein
MKISIRQLTVAGVLGALMIVMGLVGTGIIPVPNLAGAMTLMHIPIIIGAVVAGPVVGVLLGIIFAVFVSIQFGSVFPLHVLIPGRLLIGPFSYWTFDCVNRLFKAEGVASWTTAAGFAAIVGTLTNSIITLGLGVLFPTILGETMQARLVTATGIFLSNTVIELVIAVVVCVPIIVVLKKYFLNQE